MIRIMTILGAGLFGLMHPTATHAGPLDFMFSFSNTTGNVNGTVTGEIFGLTDNATGPASNVILDSYPAGLGLPTPPLTILTGITSNSFTVTDETITAATFSAEPINVSLLPIVEVIIIIGELAVIAIPQFIDLSDDIRVASTQVTFTLVQPIPEPSSFTLLGTGLGVAALWPLRRRLRWRAASA
jgi:hypothetical protein